MADMEYNVSLPKWASPFMLAPLEVGRLKALFGQYLDNRFTKNDEFIYDKLASRRRMTLAHYNIKKLENEQFKSQFLFPTLYSHFAVAGNNVLTQYWTNFDR